MAIYFLKDWKRFPKATIHYETKNESFLRLAEIYYSMGVKNNAFHLALLQPELRNVDPHDPNLDFDTKGKILVECRYNFWYYLREVARVPETGSMDAPRFKANRGNIGLFWMFFNHVMTIMVVQRQVGKTVSLGTLGAYLVSLGTTNTLINLLTKDEKLKSETLAAVKGFIEELPPYLNLSGKGDTFNSDEIHIKRFETKFQGHLSSSSPKQAEKVGRGFTSPINMIDEAAYISNIAISMGAMLMSGNQARDAAARNNKPYGTILTTSAGNTSDRDGAYIYEILNGSTVFDEKFYDAEDEKDLNELILKNSAFGKNPTGVEGVKRPMVNISLSYRQLGFSEDWLKKRLAENISTPENIKRDIFNMWLSGSNTSPIPRDLLDRLEKSRVETPRTEMYAPYGYLLKWYLSEEEIQSRKMRGHHILIGVDTSDGGGRDDISFFCRDHVTGETVCVGLFNEISLIGLADFFVDFMLKYDNSTMIIERKSSAPAMVDYMIQKFVDSGVNPFKRLYNTLVQNSDVAKDKWERVSRVRGDLDTFIENKGSIGFVTSGSGTTSRKELYSTVLMSMLTYTGDIGYDGIFIEQVSGLIVKNGRVDHPVGGNDDLVIAGLLSYWMILMGKGLGEYGIDVKMMMRGNRVRQEEKFKVDERGLSEEDIYEMEEEFDRLVEELKRERDGVLVSQLEMKLRKLASEMGGKSSVVSVEEMLEGIRRNRRIKSTSVF